MKQSLAAEYLLLLLVAAIWGASFSLIKVGVSEIGPATLTLGRITIAAITLTAWLLIFERKMLDTSLQAISYYAFIGLLGNAIPFTLIGISEQTLDSSFVAILMGIMPLFTIGMAHFFLEDEPFSKRMLFGISIGFTSLVVLLGFSIWEGAKQDIFAQALVILASICYAATTIMVRRNKRLSGLEMATGAMIAASVFSMIAAFTLENPTQLNWTMRAILPMVLLGVLPTALASVLYFRLVRNLGATRFAQINYIIPVFGSIIGAVFLDEIISWRMIIALALVLSGIYLVHGARKAAPRVI